MAICVDNICVMGKRRLRYGRFIVTAPEIANAVENEGMGSSSSTGDIPASLTWVAEGGVEAGVAAVLAAATEGLDRLRLGDAAANPLAHRLVLDESSLNLYNQRMSADANVVGHVATLVRQDTFRLPSSVAAAIVDGLSEHHTVWLCALAQTYRPTAPPAELGRAGAAVYKASPDIVHVSLMIFAADKDLYEPFNDDQYSHSFLVNGGFTPAEAHARHPPAPAQMSLPLSPVLPV